mgnify:CR=1 FL=1
MECAYLANKLIEDENYVAGRLMKNLEKMKICFRWVSSDRI